MRNSKYSIETYSGIFIDTLTPRTEDVNLDDICWALSRKPRFGGHSITKVPYNVAHHSIVVSELVRKLLRPGFKEVQDQEKLMESFYDWQVPMWVATGVDPVEASKMLETLTVEDIDRVITEAFMHDWSEAYLVDLPTPIKRIPGLGEMYNKVEENMHTTILRRFKLLPIGHNNLLSNIVRWADLLALSYEASTMVRSKGEGWRALPARTIDNPVPRPFTEHRSRKDFMSYWKRRIKPLVCKD